MENFLLTILPLYGYCEGGSGFLSQPLNLISCLVFFVAALWIWRRKDDDLARPAFHHIGSILLCLLGLSGLIWHSSGHIFAMAVDVLFLFLLLIVIVSVICNDMLNWSTLKSVITLSILISISALLKDSAVWFLPQNTGIFLPMLVFMACSSLLIQGRREKVSVYLLTGSYLLFFGLVVRGLDTSLCNILPFGIHFVFHLCIAGCAIYIHRAMLESKGMYTDN